MEKKINGSIPWKDCWRPVLIALAVAIAVAGYFYWGKFGGNITGFFRIGSELPLSPFLNAGETLIYQGELGYDGQQFLTIALDPGLQNADSIAALDHASYRYRRIFYPLLGYVLGLGNPVLIPWALVIINILAIALCTGLVAMYFRERGYSINSALGLLTIPGIWMILSLSTADLLASTLGLGAIICQQCRKFWLMTILLALGLLTRETLLIIWLALLLTIIQNRQWRSVGILSLSPIPLAVWLGYIRWRQLPGGSGTGNFGFPLVGIGEKIQALIQGGLNGSNLYEAYIWFLLCLTFATLIWLTRWGGELQILANAGWLYLGLLLVASFYILNYYLNYSRIFLDVFIFTLMVIPGASQMSIFFTPPPSQAQAPPLGKGRMGGVFLKLDRPVTPLENRKLSWAILSIWSLGSLAFLLLKS